MRNEMNLDNSKELIIISNQEFEKSLNEQHYNFAHRIVPHLIDNYFSELVNSCINKTAQDWIVKIWNDCLNNSHNQYTSLVYPTCNILMQSDKIGLIYFVMPAPRIPPEAAYSTAIFIKEKTSPTKWQRRYFTLELGLANSAYWVLGEWKNFVHHNYDNFEPEPTLQNFLTQVLLKGF
jgi:hypothetical protein